MLLLAPVAHRGAERRSRGITDACEVGESRESSLGVRYGRLERRSLLVGQRIAPFVCEQPPELCADRQEVADRAAERVRERHDFPIPVAERTRSDEPPGQWRLVRRFSDVVSRLVGSP